MALKSQAVVSFFNLPTAAGHARRNKTQHDA